MQTKKNSFREACINTLIGFIVTLVFSPFIYNLCGISYNPAQLGLATLYFTVLSVARSYVIRRFFNNKVDLNKVETCNIPGHVKISMGAGTYCNDCGILYK